MDVLLSTAVLFWGTPLLALLVSVIYFLAAPASQPLGARVLASSHGAAIALVFLVAIALSMAGYAKPSYGLPFLFALGIPVVLAVASLLVFRGHPLIHALQLLNVVCLVWAFFIGSMAITGQWL